MSHSARLDEFTREPLNEQLLSIWHSGATRIKAIIMVTTLYGGGRHVRQHYSAERRPARLLDDHPSAAAHRAILRIPNSHGPSAQLDCGEAV